MIKLGRDISFFALLESQALVALRAAKEFHLLSTNFRHMRGHIDTLRDIEHEGDELTHRLQRKVVETFITPLDKEDLRELSQLLDDVTDMIEAAAVRTELYNLEKPRPDLELLVALLVKICEQLVEVLGELKKGIHRTERLEAQLKEVHTTENESDYVFRRALADLFGEKHPDPLNVIKWKEMYDRLESAVDKCEDIAKMVEMILTKYG